MDAQDDVVRLHERCTLRHSLLKHGSHESEIYESIVRPVHNALDRDSHGRRWGRRHGSASRLRRDDGSDRGLHGHLKRGW